MYRTLLMIALLCCAGAASAQTSDNVLIRHFCRESGRSQLCFDRLDQHLDIVAMLACDQLGAHQADQMEEGHQRGLGFAS